MESARMKSVQQSCCFGPFWGGKSLYHLDSWPHWHSSMCGSWYKVLSLRLFFFLLSVKAIWDCRGEVNILLRKIGWQALEAWNPGFLVFISQYGSQWGLSTLMTEKQSYVNCIGGHERQMPIKSRLYVIVINSGLLRFLVDYLHFYFCIIMSIK